MSAVRHILMPRPRQRAFAAMAFVAAVTGVAWLSLSVQGPTADQTPGPEYPVWDKVLHLGAYAWLTILVAAALGPARRQWLGWCGLGLMIFGVWIELVQAQIPEHTASVVDAVANAVGIFGVLWAMRRVDRRGSLLE
jgi:VanZ family protein